jgi:hypothetical protein
MDAATPALDTSRPVLTATDVQSKAANRVLFAGNILVRQGMVTPGRAGGNRVWRFVPLHRIRGIEVVPGAPWGLAKPSPPG